MNLAIRSLVEKGDISKERITLRCSASTDIGHYVLFHTDTVGDVATTAVNHVMWFPNKIVDAGDLIVIYSKTGQASEKVLSTGKKAHFFYWGFRIPIWADPKAAAVLLHAPNWEFKLAGELSAQG